MGFRKGTGFTNLNKVMTANRGNTLGSTVSSGVSGQAQDVNTGIQKSQQQFDEEAQKNRLDTEENKRKRDEAIAGAGVQPVGTTAPATQPSSQQVQDFTKYRTGTYTGPKELSNNQALYGQASQAEALGGLAKSGGGRQELLRRFVGGQNYNQGQKQLDESLLGQDRSNQLAGAARQTVGATGRVSAANELAGNQAQEYVNRASQFGQETMGKLGEAQSPVNQAINDRVAAEQAAETQRAANYTDLINRFTNKDKNAAYRLNDATSFAIGQGYMNPDQANLLAKQVKLSEGLGLDTNKLLSDRFKSQIAQNVTRAGSATSAEQARMNALDALSGKTGSDVEFQRQGISPYQAGQTTFDSGSLSKYLNDTANMRASKDAAEAARLAAINGTYLNQAKTGALGALAGTGQVANNMTATPSGVVGTGIYGAGAGLNYATTDANLAVANGTTGGKLGADIAANQAEKQAALEVAQKQAAQEAAAQQYAARTGGEVAGESVGVAAPDMAYTGGGKFATSGGTTGVTEAGTAPTLSGAAGKTAAEEGVGEASTGAILGEGAAEANPIALAAMIGIDYLGGQDTTAQTAGAGIGVGANVARTGAQGTNAALEGLARLNIGGQSFANTAAGREYLKGLSQVSNAQNQAIDNTQGQLTNQYAQGLSDFTKGHKWDQAFSKMSGLDNAKKNIGDVGSTLSKAGGAVSHAISGGIGGNKKSGHGKKAFFSDKNLKTNIDYNPKDVESFLSKLKPASYDYKDEVKNDPRASKDRQLGVMAQDLEKSKLGKEAVHNEDVGKVVDYKDLEPKMLASLAALHQRLKKLEGKE